ncbi:phospholipase C/P1 nuclease family protein [Hymenobacter daeguensis]
MPFTFSHPALIIPLLHARPRHRWLSATGLITGSIAPDFEKFFRLRLASEYSHSFASIFYFSCPVALALAFLFHAVVREPLLAHLPLALQRRLGSFARFSWLAYFRQHYAGVLASIVVGAALHLLWDSFTHRNALMTRLIPMLNDTLDWNGTEIALFDILAAVSTVVGAIVIGLAIWLMPVRPGRVAVVPPAAMGRYWGLAALVAFALLVEWVLAIGPALIDGSIAAISAGLVGVLVASGYAKRMKLARARP